MIWPFKFKSGPTFKFFSPAVPSPHSFFGLSRHCTARVNAACLPVRHHKCPDGDWNPGPTAPEVNTLPLSYNLIKAQTIFLLLGWNRSDCENTLVLLRFNRLHWATGPLEFLFKVSHSVHTRCLFVLYILLLFGCKRSKIMIAMLSLFGHMLLKNYRPIVYRPLIFLDKLSLETHIFVFMFCNNY